MRPIRFNAEMVCAALDGKKTQMRSVIKNVPNKAECVASPHPWFGFETESDMYHVKPSYQSGDILWVMETWKKVCATERYYECGKCVSSEELFGHMYRADNLIRWDEREPKDDEFHLSDITRELKWHPSIHMPRDAARIFLRVTDVRVERLQDITVDGINSEGIDVEPPVICRNEEPSEEQRKKYNRLSDEQKEEYINTLARHQYMGWCKYADDLFHEWAKFWDSTIKPSDLDLKGWNANPWVWVYTFERIRKEDGG